MSSENLSISITFLNGRYHGQEWPPSAARLFQALVAGVMTCGDGRYMADVEPALRWLERQRPPAHLRQSGGRSAEIPDCCP
jgi:CRISPR-associated protein Csb2